MNLSIPEVNSALGVGRFLESLAALYKLIELRKEALSRDVVLHGYLLYGRYVLTSFGTIEECVSPTPKDLVEGFPSVVRTTDVANFMKGKKWSGRTVAAHLPAGTDRCAKCGQYFALHDCSTIKKRTISEKTYLLTDYVGKQLCEVKYFLRQKPEEYCLDPRKLIRNDRFINDQNQEGWVGQDDGFGDWYTIQAGDEILYTVTESYHQGCCR